MDKGNVFVDLELEKGFINSVLNNPEVIDDVIDDVTIRDFSNKTNKKIFAKIKNMWYKNGQISRIKVLQYINKHLGQKKANKLLESDYINPMEVEHIVEQLNMYKFRRQSRRALKQAYEVLVNQEDTGQARTKIQDIIFEATSKENGVENVADAEDVAIEALERFLERQEGKTVEKIRTGIASLDSMLNGGFSRKHLTILGARPSMGKTALALRILASILETSNTPSLVFSPEMDRVKMLDRMLIQQAKVASDDYYNIKKDDEPAITERQRNSIEIARSWIADKNLKIYDKRGLPISEVKSVSRKINNFYDGNLGFVLVDYLTKLKLNPKGGRWDKGVAEAIEELRNLAGELDLHVLLVAQINRDLKTRKNKRPLLSDLRDTGEAEEAIDNGLLLHRPAYYESREKGTDEPLMQDDAELIVAKQREGKTGVCTFVWYPEILYFQDIVDYNKNGPINYLVKGD